MGGGLQDFVLRIFYKNRSSGRPSGAEKVPSRMHIFPAPAHTMVRKREGRERGMLSLGDLDDLIFGDEEYAVSQR